MIKVTLVSVASAILLVQACVSAQDYMHDAELIISRLDFPTLNEVKNHHHEVFEKCKVYDKELREMLAEHGRNTLSENKLLEKVIYVINEKTPSAHSALIHDLSVCLELFSKGHKGKVAFDNSYAPARHVQQTTFTGPVDETIIISRLDLEGLVQTENELRAKGMKPDDKCHVIEEELREMLGNVAEGKSQEEIFNGIVCVLDRRGAHFTSSLAIWDHLSACLGSNKVEHEEFDDCWVM